MTEITFTLSGAVTVQISIAELLSGDLQFDLTVLDDTGSIGDLNAIFFDVADESLLQGLNIAGGDVTGTVFSEDRVTKVDNYTNVNGEVVKDLGRFDGGVQFGTQGIGADDIRQTSFVMSHDTQDLTLDLFLAMDFAARLTSVGEEGGARGGSAKIGGTAPDEPPVTGPENLANDDSMTVSNIEGFSDFGLPDPLDDFAFSLLDNDTSDGAPYTGAIISTEGQAFVDGIIVSGSNGGLLQVNADGSVDFSANGDFDALAVGETDTTQFVYTIEGGDDAILTVEVFGFDPDGPGGPVGVLGVNDTTSDIIG